MSSGQSCAVYILLLTGRRPEKNNISYYIVLNRSRTQCLKHMLRLTWNLDSLIYLSAVHSGMGYRLDKHCKIV